MANRFLDSGNVGSDATPFESEATAALTLLAIITDGSNPLLVGEDVYVARDHAEIPAGNVTYNFPGTPAQPTRLISALLSGPTYDKADNSQITPSGTFDFTFHNTAQFYGWEIECGDDIFTDDSLDDILFDDSIIKLTKNNSIWNLGAAAGQNRLTLKNTDVNFSHATGSANNGFAMTGGKFSWDGGKLSYAGSTPMTAVFDAFDRNVEIRCAGIDFTDITSALVDVSHEADIVAEFHHCVKSANLVLTVGTIQSVGTKILWSGVDDTGGNELFSFEYVDYYGSIFHDKGIYRDNGAADPAGVNISWKMVTTANAKEFSEPLISPPITKRIKTTGSKTFTVNIAWDSASDLQDDEVWLEVEYLGTAAGADPQSTFENDAIANILTAPVDQDNNTEAWTGVLGFGTLNRVHVAKTVTVNRVGPVICRVHLARPITTIYVDPKIEVT